MLLIYKPIGKTPFEIINYLKTENITDKKLAYAGRLDPMAEGLLVILEGDECLDRKKFENLDKKYEFEVLFGIETDSYDTLGIIKNTKFDNHYNLEEKINKYILEHPKIFDQEYPPFSSARILGKPLFYYARKNITPSSKIPSKQVAIKNIELINFDGVDFLSIYTQIAERINKVKGDFRQREILENWRVLYKKYKNINLFIAKFKIHSSSGFYVRSFVQKMGQELKVLATTFSIKRLSVGEFKLQDEKVIIPQYPLEAQG